MENILGDDYENKIYDHLLKIDSNRYLEINANDHLQTGKIETVVEGSKFDFRDFTQLGTRLSMNADPTEGYIAYYIHDLPNKEANKHLASYK